MLDQSFFGWGKGVCVEFESRFQGHKVKNGYVGIFFAFRPHSLGLCRCTLSCYT